MANWNTLKTAVTNAINANGNQAITGQLLQNVLNNIITNVGENATFAGIATPTTNPGAPDGPVFYFATTAGTYPNFNGIEVSKGEASILLWNDGAWSKKDTGFATPEISQIVLKYELAKHININGVFSGAVSNLYRATKEYYPVVEGETYITNVWVAYNYYIAFYDRNKKFISTIQKTSSKRKEEWEFIVPENACYIRFSDTYATSTDEYPIYYRAKTATSTTELILKNERNINDVEYKRYSSLQVGVEKAFDVDWESGEDVEDIQTINGLYTFNIKNVNDSPDVASFGNTYVFTLSVNGYTELSPKIFFSERPSPFNAMYRNIAIFDTNGNLVYAFKSGVPNQAYYLTVPHGTWTIQVVSHNPVKLNCSAKNAKAMIEKGYLGSVNSFVDQSHINRVLVGSFLTEESATLIEREVSWTAYDSTIHTDKYAYFNNGEATIELTENTLVNAILTNTGNSTIKLGVRLGPNPDWSKEIAVKFIDIAPGKTDVVSFNSKDWEKSANYSQGIKVRCNVAIYNSGETALPAPTEPGSVKLQVTYNQSYIYANRARKSEEADFAKIAGEAELAKKSIISNQAASSTNAGWAVGAFSNNAIFRDEIQKSQSEGYKEGAITLENLDYRTVHLITNFTIDEVGSAYRGIYWKIEYNSLEDLKGIWILYNNYAGYNTVRLSSGIKDWGPGEKDVIQLGGSSVVGSKSSFDFYTSIMNYKKVQEELGEESKWTGILETQGYLYFVLVKYHSSGLSTPFEDTLTLDHIPEYRRVIATELTDELVDELKNELSTKKIQVTNWGDSLTAGAGRYKHRHQETFLNALKAKGFETDLTASSNITYSIMMQKLLGNKYNVTNCGVGGENINTIAARLGANVVYANEAFVLPKDTSAVQIGNHLLKLKSSWGSIVSPLLQGAGNSVNPCYVQGIECTLKWTSSNYADTTGLYTIQRNSEGDRAINFSDKTPIILGGSKLYRNTEIAVLWCWQNGGYSSNDELIGKLDKMIAHINTKNYVIVGLHTGNAVSRAEQEELLASKYGDKFFNWREYVSSNALYDFGITPTTDLELTEAQTAGGVISDEAAMNEGSLPMSLWSAYIGDDLGATSNDKTHLTAVGYGILGYKLVERFRNLGYI